jgi:hypothetical protein
MSEALRYNQGKLKWSLVDFNSLEEMVKVLEYGAHKYSVFEDKDGNLIKGVDISVEEAKTLKCVRSGAHNWKLGMSKETIMNSLIRHIVALQNEDSDSESKCNHMGHVMCNAMFYLFYHKKECQETTTQQS